MRLVSFGPRYGERPGVLLGEAILDLGAVSRDLAGSWRTLLAAGALAEIRALAADPSRRPQGAMRPAATVRLGPPVPDPGKIVCVGLNYVDHAAEQGKPLPERPLLFAKAASALAGPRDDVVIPAGITHVDYEAEMAFVIGRRGRNVPQERAADFVAGYMVFNDLTARKIQREDGQWFRGKSLDTFAPCGPALVTADEVADPHALDIRLERNGEVRQASNTRNLHFRIGFLISYLSATMTLEPGDVVSTGTPGGVGAYSEPKVFLNPGDEIVTRVERLGELRNRVRAG
jgi:2-keto-4-pentenoate hydratase/2-oxohepta-3-ene-1,7-dioic acid hydratase in catechol pathway